MTEDHAHAARSRVRDARTTAARACGGSFRCVLSLEVDGAVGAAVAQPRQHVDRESPAVLPAAALRASGPACCRTCAARNSRGSARSARRASRGQRAWPAATVHCGTRPACTKQVARAGDRGSAAVVRAASPAVLRGPGRRSTSSQRVAARAGVVPDRSDGPAGAGRGCRARCAHCRPARAPGAALPATPGRG